VCRPPAVLEAAHVLGLDDHVPNPPAAPEALGALPALAALHLAAGPGIARRDREGVELEGDPRAAPAVDREAPVDLADDVGRRELERVREAPGVRREVRRLLAILRDVSEGDDAAGVATLASGALHAVGAALAEDPLLVLGEGGLDVEHEWVGLALDQAHQADPEMAEPAADDRHVHEVTPEPVEPIDPQLVEAAPLGIAQEAPAIGPLGDPLRARDGLVDVPIDERDFGLAREAAVEGVALGLDGLALALVLGADPLVGRDPPDPCPDRHLGSCPRRPGRTRGRPRTTRSAAAIASRSGDHVRSIGSDLASRRLEGELRGSGRVPREVVAIAIGAEATRTVLGC
jgi:hypothetical protein